MSLYKFLLSVFDSDETIVNGSGHIVNKQFIQTDLINKRIWVDSILVLDHAQQDPFYSFSSLIEMDDLNEYGIKDCFTNPYEVIDTLYGLYYESVDTVLGTRGKSWFPAKSSDECTFDQLLSTRLLREKARAMLECYIVLASVSQILQWKKEKMFYYKSQRYPQLILFREYIKERREIV